MRIGIVGSGQLGRMLALSGLPLGCTFTFYDQQAGTACSDLGSIRVGRYDDQASLSAFASECDVITYEFENIPCETATFLAEIAPVYPPPKALEVSQDRVIEKRYLSGLGIPTSRFSEAGSEDELNEAMNTIGFPCVVKTRRLGYDGKGQAVVRDPADTTGLWRVLGEVPLIVEELVPFVRELSVIACRGVDGDVLVYPLIENEHRNGILHRSSLPASGLTPELSAQGSAVATKVLNDLEYVGIVAIELFDLGGKLLANEMAPRVHNSGHVTLDASVTSQFENHIRALCGLALGSVETCTPAVMYNLIGVIPSIDALTRLERAKIHLYGKSPRPGRKVGHINLLTPSPETEGDMNALLFRSSLCA